MALYGNAAFPFNIHIVQNLIFKISIEDHMGHLNQAVGKCRFPVINMSDDAEISNFLHLGRQRILLGPLIGQKPVDTVFLSRYAQSPVC